jgi:hypothetical protein
MPNLEQFVDFDPEKDIPSLEGKVIFITGGEFRVHPVISSVGLHV